MYYLTIPTAQESKPGLHKSPAQTPSQGCKVLAETLAISRLDWDRICIPSLLSGCWQDLVPCEWRAQFLIVGQRSPLVAFHVASCLIKAGKKRSSGKVEIMISCSQVMEVTSYQLFHYLLVTNKPQVLSRHKGRGFHKGVNTGK